MYYIRDVAKNQNIVIKSFAFDGDTAYSILHEDYYNSYILTALHKGKLNFKTNGIRTVSDFLHLMKRLRYRVLSCLIHSGFFLESLSIDMKRIKKILHTLPPVIFNNLPYTKMHDRLPTMLFSPSSFISLFKAKAFCAVGYWFPITAAIIAMDGDNLSRSGRMFFLECSFWFLVEYKRIQDNTLEAKSLNTRKSKKGNDVSFYDNALLKEFTNTIYCSIQLLDNEPDFSFNRDSSIPLEHKFGIARNRMGDIQTFAEFASTIEEIQEFEMQCNSLKYDIKIAGRKSDFGVQVSRYDKDSEYIDNDKVISISDYSPYDIALCFLKLAGFDIDFEDENDDIAFWFYAAVSIFTDEEDTEEIKKRKRGKKSLTYAHITLGVDAANRSKSLIKNQSASLNSKDSRIKKETIEESNIQSLNDFFERTLERAPEKDDLLYLCEFIKDNDAFCPEMPNQSQSIDEFYKWFGIHFKKYEVLINSLA